MRSALVVVDGAAERRFIHGGCAFQAGRYPGEEERKCDVLITTAHLRALHELAASEAAGHALRTLTEDESQEDSYRELELQGLMALEPPRSYRLTYAGHEALRLFDTMREANLAASFDRLENDWRFLGSDILAALQAAEQNKGRVGPLTETLLSTRGLAGKDLFLPLESAWRSVVRFRQALPATPGDYRRSGQFHSSYAPGLHGQTRSADAR
jgi:hypothetical protein